MTYKTYNLKKIIAKFNFAEPDWNSLPSDFPKLSKEGLTREEGHLLDAIVLAHLATAGGWKNGALKSARISLICLIGLISLIRLAFHVQGSLAQPVQAATYTINQAFESTMSAILKR